MKDLNAVEQEMYYKKCKKIEEEIRKESKPEKRKELQKEYQQIRANITMQTLTKHMKMNKTKN